MKKYIIATIAVAIVTLPAAIPARGQETTTRSIHAAPAIAVQQTADGVVVNDAIPFAVKYFDLRDVRLLDGPFKEAMEKNAEWLLELEPDRLLSNFRLNAGLKPKARPYGSWESSGLAGHTAGHVLTAAAQQYAATGDERFKERVDYMVQELDSCQIAFVNGFIGGMPGGDRIFKQVRKGIIRSAGFDLNGLWSPWYNIHKVVAGLLDVYLLTGNEKAREVLVNLAGYLAESIAPLSNEQMQLMMNCEFGGINDSFAGVYAITGDKKFLDAANAFYHARLMDPLAEGKDVLPGLHANTQIPKVIGSARVHELTGNERDARIATFFWDRVVHHHSYANGGNSSAEYLAAPDKLNDRLTTSTCETCNTYNMLKLTRHLHEWSGDPAYVDYYERALYNHILASRNPETGMTCYFVSLAMGGRKEFSDKHNTFTCCMGSGFENHSKYGESIYARSPGNEALYVNLYIPSTLDWRDRAMAFRLETSYPESGKITLRVDNGTRQRFALKLRYPDWATSMTVKVNGTRQKVEAAPGSYATISREWKRGDRVEVDLAMELREVAMPDNADRRAIFHGPTLLAGELGTTPVEPVRGVPVFVSGDKSVTPYLLPVQGQPQTFRTRAIGYPADVTLVPFYKMYDQYYSVYWDVFSPDGWQQQQAAYEAERARVEALNKITVDYITFGEMQPERDHSLDSRESRVGDFRGKKFRYAYPNGYIAFDMKVLADAPVKLLMTFWGGDAGRDTFEILVNDTRLQLFSPSGEDGAFIENVIEIPEAFTSGKEKIRVTLKGHERSRVTSIYNCRVIR
ncbi:MAG: glycoside hydrolase family 127 protein [Odoribacteraceae bacterium]|jgi:DUF1680 family protein|nr:glycoside hydrolase family 127 protein [Odoribacteraceae bacterium]